MEGFGKHWRKFLVSLLELVFDFKADVEANLGRGTISKNKVCDGFIRYGLVIGAVVVVGLASEEMHWNCLPLPLV